MNVLMISLDASVLEPDSASAGRMKEYGSICDELHIVVLHGKNAGRRELSKNVFTYGTGSVCRFLSILEAIKIGKKILSRRNSWMITTQDPFETGLIGWFLAKKFKIGLEVQMHGDFYGNPYWRKERLINRIRFYFGKFILKKASVIRVVSRRIEKSIESFAKIKINRTPVYTEIINQNANNNFLKNKFPGAYPILLSVGNLIPVKNYGQLIEAFADIKKELPAAKLVIAGGGLLLENYKLQITNYKLQQDVWLAGYQKNLADFYSSADIFVHPSLYEGWGRAVVEAAYYGLPIIVSDVGLAGEAIEDGESGLIIPVNNKEALKRAILRLAGDKELRKRLGENAKKTMKKDVSTKWEYLDKIKKNWQAATISARMPKILG